MAYTLDFAISLGSSKTGLTLNAQVVDTGGSNVGSAITSGFTEVGTGTYLLHYASVPDAHRGGIKFYENGAAATILAFGAINPEEAESVTAILTDTAVIGVAGAGLTDLGGMSTGMKAEVNVEADTALTDYDPPTKDEMDTAHDLLATEAKQDIIDTNVDAVLLDTGTDGVAVATASKTGYQLSATGIDGILDEVVEGTYTMRQMLRLMAAVLVGESSGGGTATITFRDTADGTDRVVATVSAVGNRTAVTLDAT